MSASWLKQNWASNLTAQHRSNQPIGVFDSGIGGLTVANAILKALPNERLVYFGDTAHLPYGDKSADAIRYYCLKIAKFLLEQDCKMIVVACNSASSVGYDVLLEFFREQVLFVNVVDPLVAAVAAGQYRKVGVIATKATINSGVYQQKLAAANPAVEIVAQATPLLAPMIEEGFIHNKISQTILENYLGHPGFRNIDALLLACTHYPLIRKDIAAFLGGGVDIFDSSILVAEQAAGMLDAYHLRSPALLQSHHFFVSDYTHSFSETARRFYTHSLELEYCNIW
jgi:glutamate racemase